MEHLTVLLIEDNPGDAYLFSDMLTQSRPQDAVQDLTVDVVYADRLAKGLDYLRDGGIDVVLLDLSLPDSQGLDTLVGLEQVGCEAPVVVITGLDDLDFSLKVMQHGAQDYLIKGQVERDDLVQTLCYAIERQQLRLALRASEARFRKLIARSADGIILLDRDGVIRFANPAAQALFGRDMDELLGQTFGLPTCIERAVELDIINPHRPDMVVEMHVVEMEWEGDRAFLASLRNITERKRAEAKLHKQEAQLRQTQRIEAAGRLAGGIAHEFNNMLTSIIGYSDILAKRLDGDAGLHRYASQVSLVANRAALLTRQLLAFSRLETLQPQILDCNDVVRETEKMLRPLIGEHNALVCELRDAAWHIRADPMQLQQLLTNLVVNARDAMPQGGAIVIRTDHVTLDDADRNRYLGAPPGNYLMLEVNDTGSGMAPDVKAHLFEPFFTTKNVGQGTGLGLSVVYGIVQQNAGDIAVESELDHGTSFRVYFPRVITPLSPESSGRRLEPVGGWETILLVEDEGHVRELIREMLELQGYQVIEAENAEVALRQVVTCESPIHLLLTDVVMPGMNGYELATALSQECPDTAILLMSGHPEDVLRQQPNKRAALKLLHKPFTPEILGAKIREVLDYRPASSLAGR